MREVDRLMVEEYGIALIQMMENAGRNLAEQARRILAPKALNQCRILVLSGAGNNGGGGLVAARHLHNRAAAVAVQLVSPEQKLKPLPAQQWEILKRMGLDLNPQPDWAQVDLIIDALIGYGLHGDPQPPASEWIDAANASGKPILALDAPSGLDTTTGQPGTPCIRASATLTLALPKVGLLVRAARPFVGQLYLADIGVPPELFERIDLPIPPLFQTDTIVEVS